jgi:predicted ATPase/class 3 adenylate cyclase
MPAAPTGTITFLFTDIEGSSRLWERYPVDMGPALSGHDAILRDAIEGQGGYIFKTAGDAFYGAFETAEGAMLAAVTAQRALFRHAWHETGPLRVRMAIHTGVAEFRENDYFGPSMNRVARLLAAGHGGQVLLSFASEELVRDHLPEGVSLRDLGERRLKDLNRPERLFQLIVEGLPTEFPPLRSMEVVPNNLPVQLTSFVGREREMTEVKRLLGTTHLLTLTGTGGTGKTRLSLQVAADILETFSDGVWLVELATLADPDLLIETVMGVLGAREEPDHPLLMTLTNYLRTKNLLLIFDNCEHIIAAVAQLSDTLLRACPSLRILASSREAMGIAGETTWAVPSLSLPDMWRNQLTGHELVEALSQYEAVRLFIDRALAVQPSFQITNENAPAVAQICWRLDGIPLAIELAAARVKVLTLDQIAARLDDSFRLLTGGSRTALPRQQTLRALIDWSYDLLSESEKKLMRRLSVFVRGRTLEAVEFVCSGDGVEDFDVLDLLTLLVDKSLVTREEEAGETRYYILESVWQYGRMKLEEAGELTALRNRHLDYFVQFSEQAKDKLFNAEQVVWLEKLEFERPNLRVALEWSLESQGNAQKGLRLAGALGRFWEVRTHFKQARGLYDEILAQPEAAARTPARADALTGAGRLAWCQDDNPAAREYFHAALDLYREFNNDIMVGFVLAYLGFVERSEGETERARAHFNEISELAQKLNNPQLHAITNSGLGSLAVDDGNLQLARELKEGSLVLYRKFGDVYIISLLAWSLSRVLALLGEYEKARALLEECVASSRQIGNKWSFPYYLEGFGEIAIGEGKGERAAKLYGAAEVLRDKIGLPPPPPGDRLFYDKIVQEIRNALPEEAFKAAWDEGRAMKIEQSLAYALGKVREIRI